MRKLTIILSIALVLGLTTLCNATLWDRGGGLIYDSDQNITWLQDANYAQTSGYDADGNMTWYAATAWADQLDYGGYHDWRLPSTVDGPIGFAYDGTTTGGWNITTSEMGYMYYKNLGNPGAFDKAGNHPPLWWKEWNAGPFMNLQYVYWSETEYSFSPYPYYAWVFVFNDGLQIRENRNVTHRAWAVRDGDVASVTEPTTMLLLVPGLVGLVHLKRKLQRMPDLNHGERG